MTRKALEKFDPATLSRGHSKSFEVRNAETGYGEHHYFYRDQDGELFTYVAHRLDECRDAKNAWTKLKRAKPNKLQQLAFEVTAGIVSTAEFVDHSDVNHRAWFNNILNTQGKPARWLASERRCGSYPPLVHGMTGIYLADEDPRCSMFYPDEWKHRYGVHAYEHYVRILEEEVVQP